MSEEKRLTEIELACPVCCDDVTPMLIADPGMTSSNEDQDRWPTLECRWNHRFAVVAIPLHQFESLA